LAWTNTNKEPCVDDAEWEKGVWGTVVDGERLQKVKMQNTEWALVLLLSGWEATGEFWGGEWHMLSQFNQLTLIVVWRQDCQGRWYLTVLFN
jgi:hypothetical protein